MRGAQTIPDAVEHLRRGIALGGLDIFNSNPKLLQDDSKLTSSYMTMKENKTQFTTDTLRAVKESIQDSMYDNNRILGGIIDEIGDETSSRDRDRNRSPSRSRGRNNLRDNYRNISRSRDRDDSRDYPIDNYRDRDRGKYNSRNGRRKHQRSGTGQRNFDNIEFCNYCDITGHTTHRCYKLIEYLKRKGKKIISHDEEEVQELAQAVQKLSLNQQPEGENLNKLLKDSLSSGGNPKICPKPCPSVFYNVNPIETFGSQNDVTIPCKKKVQPVESQDILEVESNKLKMPDIDPFENDYPLEILYGKMNQESCHMMREGNAQIDTSLFIDMGFHNKDWNKYTCTESCAAIGNARHGCESLGTDIKSIRELMTQVVHCYQTMVRC